MGTTPDEAHADATPPPAGCRSSLGGQRDHEPADDRHLRLECLLRAHQRRRGHAAPRPAMARTPAMDARDARSVQARDRRSSRGGARADERGVAEAAIRARPRTPASASSSAAKSAPTWATGSIDDGRSPTRAAPFDISPRLDDVIADASDRRAPPLGGFYFSEPSRSSRAALACGPYRGFRGALTPTSRVRRAPRGAPRASGASEMAVAVVNTLVDGCRAAATSQSKMSRSRKASRRIVARSLSCPPSSTAPRPSTRIFRVARDPIAVEPRRKYPLRGPE